MILIYEGPDILSGLTQVVRKLRAFATGRRGGPTIVASGLGDIGDFTRQDDSGRGIDDVDSFVYVRTVEPRWITSDAGLKDIKHELAIAVRRHRLIGIHCDAAIRDKVQRWLDKDPRPPFRRVRPAVLQAAFLEGEIRGLWLRGTHPRRTTKPDGENLTGTRLQDALNPFEHGSFAMGSARAQMPASPERAALAGPVGTTPRKSLMWARPTDSLDGFVLLLGEALALVEEFLDAGEGVDRPFPELAVEVDTLDDVWGAFDLSVIGPEDMPVDASDELIDAAVLLDQATLEVQGDPTSPHFDLDVGFGDVGAGTIRATVSHIGETTVLRPGIKVGQTNLGPDLPLIRNALEFPELLTVRYESGHAFTEGAVFVNDNVEATFRNWDWRAFDEYDVGQEKPCSCRRPQGKACTCSPDAIHAGIGSPGDKSLFSWVLKHFNDGWLTCDDGVGEVADFVHVDLDSVLSLIHVKSAKSRSVRRGVAVDAYSLVTTQAVKNLRYLSTRELVEKLRQPSVAHPASWIEGERVASRDDICDVVASRKPSNETRVVVVQPHVHFKLYESLKNTVMPPVNRADTYRLHLLEYILNSARMTAVGLNADLRVVAALAP